MDMLNIPYIDVEDEMTMCVATSLIYRTGPGTFTPYQMVRFLVKFNITNINQPLVRPIFRISNTILGKFTKQRRHACLNPKPNFLTSQPYACVNPKPKFLTSQPYACVNPKPNFLTSQPHQQSWKRPHPHLNQ
jgi:hypothetical protein